MSLTSALTTAMAGLRANQAALSVVSSNISNAQTPGYVTQGINQVEVSSGDFGTGVRVTGVNRQLDQFVQSQLRTETAGAAYAGQIANVLNQLQSIYGTPGSAGSLENAFSNFTTAAQALSSTSGSVSAQSSMLVAAQSLAQQLNTTSNGIQALRSNAEQDIGISVGQANDAMTQIANLNTLLRGMPATDPAAANLMDQRDVAIDKLSQLMGLKVVVDNTNQANVYTTSGIQLVGGGQASQLTFTGQGNLGPQSLWNSDPTKSGAGSLLVRLPNGSNIDMIATNALSSGRIAADINLRDKTLVQAQTQIDQMASALARALSDKTTAGTGVTSGSQSGFDLDISAVLPGNSINLTYTDTLTNTQRQVTILRVDDPAALPLPDTATPDAKDRVIGINFSGGMASIVSQLNAALGPSNLQFSNTGSTLRVLDNGFGSASVNAASTTTTATTLASGDTQLPLFTDGNSLYTGVITSGGTQQLGFAARISVNNAVIADPSKLSMYSTSPATQAGDTARSDFIYSQLTSATFTYSPQTGLGSTATPFKGTLSGYMQQFLSLQGNAATSATQLQQGQDVVVSTLAQKFNEKATVNIDTEMANLIALQNTYAANAHVMSAVQNMMNTLLQVQI